MADTTNTTTADIRKAMYKSIEMEMSTDENNCIILGTFDVNGSYNIELMINSGCIFSCDMTGIRNYGKLNFTNVISSFLVEIQTFIANNKELIVVTFPSSIVKAKLYCTINSGYIDFSKTNMDNIENTEIFEVSSGLKYTALFPRKLNKITALTFNSDESSGSTTGISNIYGNFALFTKEDDESYNKALSTTYYDSYSYPTNEANSFSLETISSGYTRNNYDTVDPTRLWVAISKEIEGRDDYDLSQIPAFAILPSDGDVFYNSNNYFSNNYAYRLYFYKYEPTDKEFENHGCTFSSANDNTILEAKNGILDEVIKTSEDGDEEYLENIIYNCITKQIKYKEDNSDSNIVLRDVLENLTFAKDIQRYNMMIHNNAYVEDTLDTNEKSALCKNDWIKDNKILENINDELKSKSGTSLLYHIDVMNFGSFAEDCLSISSLKDINSSSFKMPSYDRVPESLTNSDSKKRGIFLIFALKLYPLMNIKCFENNTLSKLTPNHLINDLVDIDKGDFSNSNIFIRNVDADGGDITYGDNIIYLYKTTEYVEPETNKRLVVSVPTNDKNGTTRFTSIISEKTIVDNATGTTRTISTALTPYGINSATKKLTSSNSLSLTSSYIQEYVDGYGDFALYHSDSNNYHMRLQSTKGIDIAIGSSLDNYSTYMSFNTNTVSIKKPLVLESSVSFSDSNVALSWNSKNTLSLDYKNTTGSGQSIGLTVNGNIKATTITSDENKSKNISATNISSNSISTDTLNSKNNYPSLTIKPLINSNSGLITNNSIYLKDDLAKYDFEVIDDYIDLSELSNNYLTVFNADTKNDVSFPLLLNIGTDNKHCVYEISSEVYNDYYGFKVETYETKNLPEDYTPNKSFKFAGVTSAHKRIVIYAIAYNNRNFDDDIRKSMTELSASSLAGLRSQLEYYASKYEGCLYYVKDDELEKYAYFSSGTLRPYKNNDPTTIGVGWHVTWVAYNFNPEKIKISDEVKSFINSNSSETLTYSLGYKTAALQIDSDKVAVGREQYDSAAVTIGTETTYAYINSKGTSWTFPSDRRDKFDIREISSALDFINHLSPVSYNMNIREKYIQNGEINTADYKNGTNKTPIRSSGLIAQDVSAALKDVYGDEDYVGMVDYANDTGTGMFDRYSLSYDSLIPFLIGAVKELSEIVKEQKEEIEKLKKK